MISLSAANDDDGADADEDDRVKQKKETRYEKREDALSSRHACGGGGIGNSSASVYVFGVERR